MENNFNSKLRWANTLVIIGFLLLALISVLMAIGHSNGADVMRFSFIRFLLLGLSLLLAGLYYRHLINAKALNVEPDFEVKFWECPSCQHMNDNVVFTCSACGYSLK